MPVLGYTVIMQSIVSWTFFSFFMGGGWRANYIKRKKTSLIFMEMHDVSYIHVYSLALSQLVHVLGVR